MNNKQFMEELKNKREQYGISQNQLAVACEMSRAYLNRIENGKVQITEKKQKEILKQVERFNPEEPLFLLIDYFSVRFPTIEATKVIEEVLQIKTNHFYHEEHGKYGYDEQFTIGEIVVLLSHNEVLGTFLELRGKGCRQIESYLLAQERNWYDFMLSCLTAGGVIKRLDLAINDRVGILDIPKLIEKWENGEVKTVFRKQRHFNGSEQKGNDIPKSTGQTLYIGSPKSEMYMCVYEKALEQYVKNGTSIEEASIKNRFEIRLRNERAYHAVIDLISYHDVERTAFSIINKYVCFLDREEGKSKKSWKINKDWAWFIGEHREKLRLTTQPEPYTLERSLNWLARQVAPTLKMVQELDKINDTTILQDMLEHTELKNKQKHILQLEQTNIEECITSGHEKV